MLQDIFIHMSCSPAKYLFLLLLLGLSLPAPRALADTPGVVLDDEERQWIQEHPIIRLGVDPAWPPFDFIDGQGAHSGMAADFLHLLGQRLGLSFELVAGLDWDQVLQRARDRSLDLVSLSQETPERSKYLHFSDTVTSVPWVVITRKDFKKISGLEDLSAHRVAVVKSYAIVYMVRNDYPDIEIHEMASSLDGLRAVASGQVDAMVESLAVASYLMSDNNLVNLTIATDSGFDMMQLAFGVRSDWPEFLGLLNKAVGSLTRDEVKVIKNRWSAIAAEPAGAGNGTSDIAGWLFWTVVAVFILLAVSFWLLGRFTSSEQLASRMGSARFHTLVLVCLSVFVALVLFLGWMAMEQIEQRIRDDAGNNLENSLVSTIQRINFWADQRKDYIRQLGRHPGLATITEALLGVPPAHDALLVSHPLQQARAFFSDDNLDLFDHLGFFIISPDYTNVGSMRDTNLGERNLIAELMPDLLPRVFRGETVFVPSIASDVTLSAPSGTSSATMFFAAPIQAADGEVIAALTLRVDPGGEFSQVLQFSRVGDTGDSYAFNRQGQLLSASRFHENLREAGLIGEGESEILKVEIRDPGGDLTEGYRPASTTDTAQPLTLMATGAIRMADSHAGLFKQQQEVLRNTDGYRDYRGVLAFGAGTWLHELGIGLASEIGVDEALATYNSVRNTVFGILAVTLLLSVGGTWLMLIMGQRTNRVLSQARDQLEQRVVERTSELQASEATSRKSQERFKSLLDSTPDPMVIVDDEARITYVNSKAMHTLGYVRDELLGKEIEILVPKSLRDGHPALRNAYIEAPSPLGISGGLRELSAQCKDGRLIPIDLSLNPIHIEGEGLMVAAALRDITQHKEMQADLEKARQAADQANQAKSAFLANMSHELRTPMNAILGYSEMLIEEAEDLEQEEFIPDLKKINNAGTHLLSLINDVLDLSKIESGKMEAFAERIGLDMLIDEVSAIAQPLMSKNSNKLSIERGQQLGNAHQDLTKLRQTLYNLLSNAAKFTHDGTITLHVNRTEQAGRDWLTIAVSDTGIGIAEDKLDHVFADFAQADDSTTRNYGGTGLGLAISRRFCQLLGGDLSVHSSLGEGTTFTIRVPAILPGSKPESSLAHAAPAMNETELEVLRDAERNANILVIDDDPEACEIFERYLVKDGFSVVTATSGEQGLRLAHELQPAAITLDVIMPEMDGWSVLRALKADPVLRKIPVIMLSMLDDRTRGYSLGAVDYLTKPVDREQLQKALSRYYSDEDDSVVMLVEDDTATRELMARTLEKSGWSVTEACNGKEALDMMVTSEPRLILLDLMMPVMDGFSFVAALRERPNWQSIPVIVITAKDLTREDRERLNGMVEDVLEKNAYTREDLLEHVREAVASCNIR